MTTRTAYSSRRCTLGAAIPCLLFLLLILPSKYTSLYLTREGLRTATTLEIMDESRGLGGQILGYNYYRHPVWVHGVIAVAASAAGYGLPFALCILLARRLNRNGTATLCGRCGTDIDRSGGFVLTPSGLQCPACKELPREVS